MYLLDGNLSICLQEVPLNIGRAGACVVVVKLPWACFELFFFFFMATLETNETTTGWTNKEGDQGRARRDLWGFFCFPFNWALQMVLRELRLSRHYEPLSLSLVDRPAPLGSIPHSSHSHPIKNFHRLGWAVTRAKPLLIFYLFKFLVNVGQTWSKQPCSALPLRDFFLSVPSNKTIFLGFYLTLMSAKWG